MDQWESKKDLLPLAGCGKGRKAWDVAKTEPKDTRLDRKRILKRKRSKMLVEPRRRLPRRLRLLLSRTSPMMLDRFCQK